MTNQITIAPAIVSVFGNTAGERKLSALANASAPVFYALANEKGDVGKAARAGVANHGIDGIINACSNNNFTPLAQYLSAKLGEGTVISNRNSFMALPDVFEMKIMKVKASKSGGYRMGKEGVEVPNAALALAMTLKAECMEIIARANELYAKRRADQAAKDLAIANL